MHERYLIILMSITRLAASTMIVPTALVAGILTFPTTCTCGSDIPHEHPLLGLTGHHHGPQQERQTGSNAAVDNSDTHGVSVQAPSTSASLALQAVGTANQTLQPLPRPTHAIEEAITRDGTLSMPDVPPPRSFA